MIDDLKQALTIHLRTQPNGLNDTFEQFTGIRLTLERAAKQLSEMGELEPVFVKDSDFLKTIELLKNQVGMLEHLLKTQDRKRKAAWSALMRLSE